MTSCPSPPIDAFRPRRLPFDEEEVATQPMDESEDEATADGSAFACPECGVELEGHMEMWLYHEDPLTMVDSFSSMATLVTRTLRARVPRARDPPEVVGNWLQAVRLLTDLTEMLEMDLAALQTPPSHFRSPSVGPDGTDDN